MTVLTVVLSLLLLGVVIFLISAPLRAAGARRSAGRDDATSLTRRSPLAGPSPERAELEAAREAKYREIRDAELDYRTGKLSQEDYAAVDGTLRAEALEILNGLQRVEREESSIPDARSGDSRAAADE